MALLGFLNTFWFQNGQNYWFLAYTRIQWLKNAKILNEDIYDECLRRAKAFVEILSKI